MPQERRAGEGEYLAQRSPHPARLASQPPAQGAREESSARAIFIEDKMAKKSKKRRSPPRRKVDPVVVEIVRNGVIAVTEEMKTNLMRTAYNMIIYEALDFTTGLFTPAGETVSIGIGLPMFIRGMAETVKAKIKHFGIQEHQAGRHLRHQRFLHHRQPSQPFHLHAADLPQGQARRLLLLHGALARRRRRARRHEHRHLFRRHPDPDPEISGSRQGQRGPGRHHPHERPLAAARDGRPARADHRGQDRRAALSRTARPLRAGRGDGLDRRDHGPRRGRRPRPHQDHPDGVYEAESSLDDDGLDVGKRIPVKVKVTVKGDEMTIDLTDVSKQVRGFYNSAITTGYACAQVAYKCITSPTDYPINDGAFRSLKVIIPPGRIVSAVRPAPMRYWMTFPMTIVDTIFKALQPAIPDRVIAGHHADLVAPSFHGFNPKTSELFIGTFGPLGGGWGAKKTEDGVSATVCLNDGDTHNGPNEQAEAKFPIMVERFELIPDSGGAGRHRGGLGIARTTRALTNVTVNTQSERSACPPWGLDGGGEATGNKVAFRFGDRMEVGFPQRQGAGGAAQAGRCVPHLIGRRRRLRRAVRAAGRGRARGRAAGLCVGEGRGRALRRGCRSRDLCGRSGGDGQAPRGKKLTEAILWPMSFQPIHPRWPRPAAITATRSRPMASSSFPANCRSRPTAPSSTRRRSSSRRSRCSTMSRWR